MRIVMTGGSSGIGLEAARILVAQGHELIIGARKAGPTALDLAALDSVREFAAQVGPQPIDVLLLNAGGQQVGNAVSAEGHELTFAVNHLAHYVLARLLAPAMAPGGRMILTASGTHDPAQKTGMPAPRHADAYRLAHPATDPDRDANPGKAGRRAYSASKLLNVMTARELARRLGDTRPDLMVAAFDPGFNPGTGLARDYNWVVRGLFRRVLPLVIRGSRVSNPGQSGRLLAAMATEPRYAASRGTYWAYRSGTLIDEPPSVLARDDAACAKLWRESAELAGLPAD